MDYALSFGCKKRLYLEIRSSKFDLLEIVNAILYKLKSGCQWRFLPLGHLFSGEPPSWNTVFQHYRRWCVKDEWRKAYDNVVNQNKAALDLSLSHIDGSHTPALRGGECVEYQGRKKRRTTNALFFTDDQAFRWLCPSLRQETMQTSMR